MNMASIGKYEIESDVVVIGYGGAGAATAITAYDNGANVVILEKMPIGGGNTRVSGGMITLPASKDYIQFLEILTYKNTETEILETFVEESLKTENWIRELGGELTKSVALRAYIPFPNAIDYPHIPFADQALKKMIKGATEGPTIESPGGERLWKLLSNGVERRDIKVLTNTPAKELIQNGNGRIVGVKAEKEGKDFNVLANKAVVLTCGGFEYDETLKWDSLPVKPAYSHGNPGNTGDGIRMAQKVGAGLWHMANLSCSIGFKAPEYDATFCIKFSSERFILVDKYGKRFSDEATTEIHEYGRQLAYFDERDQIEYPRVPLYAIFDEPMRRRAPLYDPIMGYNRDRYIWSLDNSEEVKKGWIVKEKSIAKLARKLLIDENTLENTMAKYNEYCIQGNDLDFGRPKEFLVPIDTPPYYAIKLWPGLFNTQGGPRRDKDARILDAFGKPIPGLYAAGELGSIWGQLYIGGSNNAESMAFGRIAGRNAAAETTGDS